ncbi:cytidine deaminase [Vibrio sonorensis]|uniref:cytidine deaminase n=1 Tax=Vibrio sonorensis TaxID=1004316 RepID=UPI0008DB2167|nr:cytidine deaminase [Vibrio sonorensis]
MNSRINNVLKDMPVALTTVLTPIVTSKDFDATLSAEQFDNLRRESQLSDADLRVALLPLAAAFSYAPISEFYVGAIVRGLSGRLYFGANVEISGAQLGQTVHAEQSAISHAWMKGEKGLTDITINYSPCGHCRQFMNELTTANELVIQLPERDAKPLGEYLPESFGPADLGITTGLMSSVDHQHSTEDPDPLVLQALAALNMSHAPYTRNISGVALQTKDGRTFKGAYAENAAFNPSLPPLQVAMIQVLMAGYSLKEIDNAALVELAEGKISHLSDTQSTLEAVDPDIPLSYLTI